MLIRNSHILVTGANGFVGKHLCQLLLTAGYSVRALVRSESGKASLPVHADLEVEVIGDLRYVENWAHLIAGMDTVIHLAAHVHRMGKIDKTEVNTFFDVNVDVTEKIVKAITASVPPIRRLIYLSTIKVNGEWTRPGHPFRPEDVPYPQDAYAMSKYQAEQVIRKALYSSPTQWVIIRPPLIYGEGVGGNVKTLSMFLKKYGYFPLPIGQFKNQRSLVEVDLLSRFMITCIEHPRAANEVFLISDGKDYSTEEIFRKIASMVGRKRLWVISVSLPILRLLAKGLGKLSAFNRLTENLQVDISKNIGLK